MASRVVLDGDLDFFRSDELRAALAPLERGSIVDLSSARIIDASFLGILASQAERLGTQSLTIVVSSPQMRRVLNIVRFDENFVLVDAWRSSNATSKRVEFMRLSAV